METQEGLIPIPRAFRCRDDGPSSSRNLVVCIDGTSNQFGPKNTNVIRLYSHITKNDRQLKHYSSGLGAITKIAVPSLRRRLVSNEVDMAVGRNLHKIIIASYRWLCENYQDGDRIFLFGFSRGAYQVRALAGMISRVGLLPPGNNEQIPFAFELYLKTANDDSETADDDSKTADDDSSLAQSASIISQPTTKESKRKVKYSETARTFQRTFCRGNVHIHFVGVWDTVSSVGFGRGKTLPCTTTSFLPEYVYGGRSSCSEDGRIKEVWFAGTHTDVGGGNKRNERLQSGGIPLLWMRSQAVAAGLTMEPIDVKWKVDDLNKRIMPSLVWRWWLLELLPLRRLLYCNSDRQTIRPHFGEPRRILPGQKVHVSALFKSNYKPCAKFYKNPEAWPDPVFWNDEGSLQSLSDSWEKDIFDESIILALLDGLHPGRPNLDALDRLGFMANFEVCRRALCDNQNAKRILDPFLNSPERLIRLSTVVSYCKLGWTQEWHLETTHAELGKKITDDISGLLSDDKDHRRACIYLPSLCKWTDLKAQLISDENLRMLVRLCDNMRVGKHEEGTFTTAFHSAHALSTLMKLDDTLAERLVDIQAVGDITQALRSNCNPVLVSALNVLNGLAKYKSGRDSMKSGPMVATFLNQVKHFDDFVASAAVRVLCSLLPEDDPRMVMLRFGVLSIFMDMLDRCSNEAKQVACHALVEFARYDDVRAVLSHEGYLQAIAKRVQCHVAGRRDGAISALIMLSNTQVRTAVTEAIKAVKTIPIIIARLGHKSTAFSAASVLVRLVQIDDVATMVSESGSSAGVGIVSMLQHRWFDGVCGEDGLQILSELLECESLRSMVLKAGLINTLCEMINSSHCESTYVGLHLIRAIARFDENGSGPLFRETPSLVPHIVGALRILHRGVQEIALEILRFLSAGGTIDSEASIGDLRTSITDELLRLLTDRQAHVVLAASTLLCFLASDKSVRAKVVMEGAFQNLSQEYYHGLKLKYDEKGRGPCADEVYRSVGHMIELMHVSSSDETGPTSLEKSKEAHIDLDRDRDRDKDY